MKARNETACAPRFEAASPEGASVIERLRSHLADTHDPLTPGLVAGPRAAGEIPEEADLVEEGYLDSMGLMDLVSFIESEFQVKVENDELRHENLSTLAACARFVLSKMSKGERRG